MRFPGGLAVIVVFAVVTGIFVPGYLPPRDSDMVGAANELVVPGGRITKTIISTQSTPVRNFRAGVSFTIPGDRDIVLARSIENAEHAGFIHVGTTRLPGGSTAHFERKGVSASMSFSTDTHSVFISARRDTDRNSELRPYAALAGAGFGLLCWLVGMAIGARSKRKSDPLASS